MSLHLTNEMLAHCYDYMTVTRPFIEWNLPASEDIHFQVIRDPRYFGWYDIIGGKDTISISRSRVGQTATLFPQMAHEMAHMVLRRNGLVIDPTVHNAAFWKLARTICREHGWDHLNF